MNKIIIFLFVFSSLYLGAEDYYAIVQPNGWDAVDSQKIRCSLEDIKANIDDSFIFHADKILINKDKCTYNSGKIYIDSRYIVNLEYAFEISMDNMENEAGYYTFRHDSNQLLFILSSQENVKFKIKKGNSVYFYPEYDEPIVAPAGIQIYDTGNLRPVFFLNLPGEVIMGDVMQNNPSSLTYNIGDCIGKFDSIGSLLLSFSSPKKVINLLPIFVIDTTLHSESNNK